MAPPPSTSGSRIASTSKAAMARPKTSSSCSPGWSPWTGQSAVDINSPLGSMLGRLPTLHVGCLAHDGRMIVTCPKCFRADDVSWQRLPDHMIAYICSAGHDGTGSHDWVGTEAAVVNEDSAPEGVTDELLEPLSACVEA